LQYRKAISAEEKEDLKGKVRLDIVKIPDKNALINVSGDFTGQLDRT